MLRAQSRQGKNKRKSGVYMQVNEHFEIIFNTVSTSVVVLRKA